MSEKHTLLVEGERSLVFQPVLAKIIGLNESIVLQQIHYWIENGKKANRNFHEGKYWVYNSYDEWQKQFPFWSKNTIIRALKSLEDKEILIVGNFNKRNYDKTKWYSVNYNFLYIILNENIPYAQNEGSTQNDYTDYPDWVDGYNQNGFTNTIEYPNISSKNFNYKVKSSEEHFNKFNFSYDILNKQIEKIHWQLVEEDYTTYLYSAEEYKEIFKYFYESYYSYTGHEHTKLKNHHIKTIMEGLPLISGDTLNEVLEDYEDNLILIDAYFQQPWYKHKDIDPTILHFMSGNIRELRYYEKIYRQP